MSDYHNETSQAERLAALENDQAQLSSAPLTASTASQGLTYLSRAVATMGNELGGRFSHLARGQQTVVGTGPNPYPQQPANSPWAADVAGTEPPLGQDVNKG
jgi:hypothetical protein